MRLIVWCGRGSCSLNAHTYSIRYDSVLRTEKKPVISQVLTVVFILYISNVEGCLPSISNKCDHFHAAHVSNYFQINNNQLLKFVAKKNEEER